MFRPIKWLFLSALVVGGAGFVLFGTDLGSYLGTVASSVKESVEGRIPVEFELKRAEKLIDEIAPQIEQCKRDTARAEVELEELQESVLHLEKVVAGEEKKLASGARLLSSDGGDVEYRLTSDFYARRRVEIELERTLDSYKNNRAILKTKRALIERQMEAVAAAKQRLAAVRAEKESLEDQVRALKTQQKWIEAMAASSTRFDLDDSALSQAKEALAKVRKRLDVAQRMLENDMVWHQGEVTAEPSSRDVLREIREELGAAEATVEVGTADGFAHER